MDDFFLGGGTLGECIMLFISSSMIAIIFILGEFLQEIILLEFYKLFFYLLNVLFFSNCYEEIIGSNGRVCWIL